MCFLGEIICLNSRKLSMNPSGGSQGSITRRLRLKEKIFCFCFRAFVRTYPHLAHILHSILHGYQWENPLYCSLFHKLISAVYLYVSPLIFYRVLGWDSCVSWSSSASFQTCVCTCIKWWIEVCVRGLLCCGPMTHLCHILLLLINVDDTIFYTLSLTINGNYAMLFNCHR